MTTLPDLLIVVTDVCVFVANSKSISKDTIVQLAPDCRVIASDIDGEQSALDKLRDWKPDILYAHGLLAGPIKRLPLSKSPNRFSSSTCITVLVFQVVSVLRSQALRPCSRTFGPSLLVLYHARRCGGLSPITMISRYFKEKSRLQGLLNSTQ